MKIKDVKKEKEKVKIVFDDGNYLFLSIENYLSNPLIINNEIDKVQIDMLIENENYLSIKKDLLSVLHKKKLSEAEIKNYLESKDLEKERVNNLIVDAKRQHLIDDDALASSIVRKEFLALKGKSFIREILSKRKIKQSIIDKVIDGEINQEDYINNIKKIFLKYQKMYRNDPYLVYKKKITNSLHNLGYSQEDLDSIDSFQSDYDEEKELSNARKDLEKILKASFRKEEKNNIQKIKIKLANKGYKHDIINQVFLEVDANEKN